VLFEVINSSGAISLELIPYLDCNPSAQHDLNIHFGHIVVDIHSFHRGSIVIVNTSYESSDVGWSNLFKGSYFASTYTLSRL
jgi:hypothetical protein